MPANKKPQPPGTYPIKWIIAVRKAMNTMDWVSIAWARGYTASQSRMSRLRGFRDSLSLWPEYFPDLGRIRRTHTLAFRKVEFDTMGLNGNGVAFDIQAKWVPATQETLDVIEKVLNEED